MAQNNRQTTRTLVTYYSATGTTARIAQTLAKVTGGELFHITPAETYTPADLDWHNARSRSSIEMKDPAARPALKTTKDNIADYDTIFIGYPIWWNLAPRIINTFIESHDLSGKTVIPFATSGGSTITNSVAALKAAYPAINWKNGRLLNRVGETTVRTWLETL